MSMCKDKIQNYKLHHMKLGKVKNLDKDNFTEFKINNIKDLYWKLREEKRSALTKSVCRYCFYL